MSSYSMFDSIMLREARKEAKEKGVKLPTRIVALKVGRQQWAVQADFPHNFDHYVSASSAAEAKAKWIQQLIEAADPRVICTGCGEEISQSEAHYGDHADTFSGTTWHCKECWIRCSEAR